MELDFVTKTPMLIHSLISCISIIHTESYVHRNQEHISAKFDERVIENQKVFVNPPSKEGFQSVLNPEEAS